MKRAVGHVGIAVGVLVGAARCGALEDLGPPPDVGSLDGSADARLDASDAQLDASDAQLDARDAQANPIPPVDAAPGTFALTVDVTQATVVRGGVTQIAVHVIPSSGDVGPIQVTASGLPNGTTADSLIIPSGSTTESLTLRATATATETTSATLTLKGTAGAVVGSGASLALTVRGLPGTLDETFGAAGVATVPIYQSSAIGPGWEWPTPPLAGIAIQPDGKIVYGGHGYIFSPAIQDTWPLIVGRLNADGSPDTSFNATGPLPGALVELPEGTASLVASGQGSVQVLPSGNIVIGGYASVSGAPPVPAVAEFTPDGFPAAFGANGLVAIWSDFLDARPGGFVVGANGTMTLGSQVGSAGPALARLLSTGAPDTTFAPSPPDGGVGLVSYAGYPNGDCGPMIDLGNGDLLVGIAGSTPNAPFPLAVAVSSKDGTLDDKFGAQGLLTDPAFSGDAQGIALAPDGSVIFVGSTATTIGSLGSPVGCSTGRSGDLDSASPTIPGGNTSAGSIAIASTGAIVVGATLPGSASIGVVRLTAAGLLDSTFAGGYAGIAPLEGSTDAGPTQVAIDALGRIVFGTMVTISASSASGAPAVQIARFWP